MCVSGGDVAPLVGHNAFLRWEALQKCAFVDPADGVERFWSESSVSEDFDMALRLQARNFNMSDKSSPARCLLLPA